MGHFFRSEGLAALQGGTLIFAPGVREGGRGSPSSQGQAAAAEKYRRSPFFYVSAIKETALCVWLSLGLYVFRPPPPPKEQLLFCIATVVLSGGQVQTVSW